MSIPSPLKDGFYIRPIRPDRRWVRYFVKYYNYIIGILISLIVFFSLGSYNMGMSLFVLGAYWVYIILKSYNFNKGKLREIYSRPYVQLARVLGLVFCTTLLLYYVYNKTDYLGMIQSDTLWLLYFPAISAISQRGSRNVFFLVLFTILVCLFFVHPPEGMAITAFFKPVTFHVLIEALWLVLLSLSFYVLLRFMSDTVADLNLIINVQNRMREMEGAFLRSSVRLDEKDYLEKVVEIIRGDLFYDHVNIFRLDKFSKDLQIVAGACERSKELVSKGFCIPLLNEKSIVAFTAATQEPYSSNDVLRDPHYMQHKAFPYTRAELAVPIIVRHRLYGVLDIQVHQPDYFLEQDVTALEILANYIGWVIDNSEQFNHISWTNRMVETIAAPLFTQARLDETIQEIADSAVHELDADLVFLYSYDPNSDEKLSTPIYAGTLFRPELMDPASIDPDNVVFRLVDNGEPMYINEDLSSVDLGAHPLFRPSPTHIRTGRPTFIEREGIQSNVIVRLTINQQCLGILFLNFRRTRTFTEWDKKRYYSFAHLAALAIQKGQLQQHVIQREKNELSNLIHDMLIGDTLGLFKILNSVNQALNTEKEPSDKTKLKMSQAIEEMEHLHNDIRWINRLLKDSPFNDLMLELDKLFMMFRNVFNVKAEPEWYGDTSQIPPKLARELFIVIKEAMTNAVRHGKAKNIFFTGRVKNNELSAEIMDDGVGFDQQLVKHKNGLLSMQYRIEEMGGSFDLTSNPGKGTKIAFRVPTLLTSEVKNG